MPIDPNIAAGVQPIQIPNQLANYAQFAQLQKYTQDIANEAKLNEAYSKSMNPSGEVDPASLRRNLVEAKLASKLPTIEKSLLETRDLKAKVGKGELELGIAKANQGIRELANYNTVADVNAHIDQALAGGGMTAEKAQQIRASLPANDAGMAQWQIGMLRQTLDAKDRLEQHFVSQSNGNTNQVLSMPKYGGGPAQVVPGSVSKVGPTIADQLAREKFTWEKANPGFELKEAEDGTIVGVNKRTLQAFPVTMGGAAAPAAATATSPRVPATPAVTPAAQVIPGMNSVLDQAAPATATGPTPLKGKATALTESQGNATAFGMRMLESNKLINDLEKKDVVSGGRIKGAVENTLRITPLVGEPLAEAGGAVVNALPGVLGGPNSKQQQYQQAKMNFITAVLRKESGASIGQNEFTTEDKKYFPQPGDDAENIAQKKRARELAIEAMKIQAGPGAKHIGAGGGGGGIAPSATDPLGLGLRPGG